MDEDDPLFGPSRPRRTELRRAPLTGVIAQLRFPEIFSIQKKEFTAAFQEKVRNSYPFAEEQHALSVQMGDGAPSIKNATRWKFSDPEKIWTISLAPDFLALETKVYTSRPDFAERLRYILDAMNATIRPTIVTRTGVRYVNRIREPEIDFLRELFRAEIGSFSSSPLKKHIEHSLTEALCRTQEGKLLLRWGLMPAGASHDLGLAPPIESVSWIFDLDSFVDQQSVPFEPKLLTETAHALATRINTFFYWAAQDKLLEVFGGENA